MLGSLLILLIFPFSDGNATEHVSNRLIYDEERKYGKIPARMYWLYLKSCGMNVVTTFFLSAMTQQGLRVYTDFWLQNWTERTQQLQEANKADVRLLTCVKHFFRFRFLDVYIKAFRFHLCDAFHSRCMRCKSGPVVMFLIGLKL